MTSPPDSIEICVGPDDAPVVVGRAYASTGRGTLTTTIEYAAGYLARPDAWPVSPDLPLVRRSVVAGLPGAVADSAPDRWGRTLIERRIRSDALAAGRTPPTVTEVDYLLGVSDMTRQGALRYRVEPTGAFLAEGSDVPRLVDLPELLDAADQVARSGVNDLAAVRTLLDAGSASLGGARPKASLRDRDRLSIAKFPHPADRWDVMAWEMTALDLAARCGIDVPASSLVDVGGRGVLVVERFDREGGARIPYASARSMVGGAEREQADYLEIAEALGGRGAEPLRDLAGLFRRVAFSIAIHNTDDHLRNHGFLWRGNGWVLAPVFDVNPDPTPGSTRVTSIGWTVSPADEVDALLASCEYFGLDRGEAEEVWREVRAAVAGWRDVAASHGISRDERQAFAAVLDRHAAG